MSRIYATVDSYHPELGVCYEYVQDMSKIRVAVIYVIFSS